MSHAFPLARSAAEAVEAAESAARTRHEAEAEAGETEVLALETEWLTLSQAEADAIFEASQSGPGKGFIQTYEDADGRPVLAITYWKLAGGSAPVPETRPEPEKPDAPAAEAGSKPADHTDDLYFRQGRTRKRKRKPKTDPRQLDLFKGPDQRGYERADPDNPGIMLTEEEGDGTTFGG